MVDKHTNSGSYEDRSRMFINPSASTSLDMNDVQFADLSEGSLNQIRKLEHALRRDTERQIYLLAYEKPDDSPFPRH